jgi:hypothetical protein
MLPGKTRVRISIPLGLLVLAPAIAVAAGIGESRPAAPKSDAGASGVLISQGRVFIEGQEMAPTTTRYRSPKTGALYLIKRSGKRLTVSSERGARDGTVNIEAHSNGGGTVNAGKVVVNSSD